VISLEDVIGLFAIGDGESGESGFSSLKYIMDECERGILKNCLEQCSTITQAGMLLGVSQPTMSRKLAYHKLAPGIKEDAPPEPE
jgi:transcriptional regulator with PAS, ATPase and Fis domain